MRSAAERTEKLVESDAGKVVSTGFNLLGFSSYLGTALWGVILIAVMLANRLLSSRKGS